MEHGALAVDKGNGVKLGLLSSLVKYTGDFLFALLIFVIMLDPTAKVLHLKDIIFVLLVAYNMAFRKPEVRYVPHLAAIFSAILICYVIAEMQKNTIDYDQLLAVFKSFAPLVMLLWIRHYNVIKLSLIPGALMGVLISTLYILAASNHVIEMLIYRFVGQYDDMIMMSHRTFLGFTFFNMYYKSVTSLVFVLFMFLFMLFNKQTRFRWLVLIFALLLVFSFLVSGSRSTILLPVALLGLVTYKYVSGSRYLKYFIYPAIVLLAVSFVALIVLLASEKSEASNVIKYGHLESYANLFTEHPEYILFGEGPATKFYSIGFHRMTLLTEWTYLELLRNYGLFSLLILASVLYPLYNILKDYKNSLSFGIGCTYIIYFFVAGTNPLLFSSTGMVMILSAYSYERSLVELRKTKK